jgi:Fe(3+) dicitrate transport protein
VPVAPGEEDGADPEESVNYELGARAARRGVRGEIIGFFSDYSNLKGTCTVSSGCDPADVDREFNGGRVHVWGAEVTLGGELALGRFTLPALLTYTLTRSSFQSGFASSNPQWGTVEPGDELPYLPVHQLALVAGLRGAGWEAAVTGRYTGAMRDVAGQGDVPDGERTSASTVVDVALNYQIAGWGKAYLTIDNLFDQAAIVSRRPYGARPGVPRLVIAGYKHTL